VRGGALTAALVALGVAAGCDRGSAGGAAAPVDRPRRAVVTTGELGERLLLTGELRPVAAIDLIVPRTDAWELSIRWIAEDGAAVKAGERVLEFDNSAFTNQLEQKKLQLRQAETDLRSGRDVSALATADKEAEVREKAAALDKARLLAGVPADLLPGRTAQERQVELGRAQAALLSAQTELEAQRKAAALDLEVKQIALDKAAAAIAYATQAMEELALEAPRDGIIMIGEHPWEDRAFQVGDSVQPGWAVVSLPELARGFEVHAELSDVDDGRLAAGAAATCTLDAYPERPMPCTVERLSPVARSEGRQTLRKAFDVVLTLAEQDGLAARPGMSVKVEVRGTTHREALLVPRGAVLVAGAAGKVRQPGGAVRDVALGPCDAQACVVERGLAAGDAVEIGGVP